MKIAFFTYSQLEHAGGFENYIIKLAATLADNKNHYIEIFSFDTKMSENLLKMLSIYYKKHMPASTMHKVTFEDVQNQLGKARYTKAASFSEMKEKLKAFDVIYSKNEILEAFVLKFLIGYKSLPKIIFGVHTPHYYPITNKIQSKIHNLLYTTFIYNILTSGVTAFHVSNNDSFVRMQKQLKNKPFYKIPYPFDVDTFRKSANKHIFQYPWESAKINIGWIGRLIEQKGVDTLKLLIDDINNTKQAKIVDWHIFGDGEEKQVIEALINKYKNVHYHGHINNMYIPDILKNLSFVVSTSKWEVSPYNVTEALAMDKPVAAFNIPGPIDLIENNKTGLLANNYEELLADTKKIITNPKSYKGMSESIKRKLDPQKIYLRLEAMFNDVANK